MKNQKSRICNKLIQLLILIVISLFPSEKVYSQLRTDTIVLENEEIKLVHYYYSESNNDFITKNLYEKINKGEITLEDVFVYKYTFSRFYVINKLTNDTMFNHFSLPFNDIYISKENNLIIGLSEFRCSPFNIFVFDLSGKVIFKKHVCFSEAKFGLKEIKYFKNNFENDFRLLTSLNRITKYKSKWYVDYDFGFKNFEDRILDIEISYLDSFIERTPFFKPNFSTNGEILFYSKREPISRVKVTNNKLKWIEFNGMFNQLKFKIKVNKKL